MLNTLFNLWTWSRIGKYLLALVGVLLAHVVTVEELSIEELNSYHSKDEVEEQVDDQDVKDVFQWVDDAVKDGFQLGNPFDGLKRPQDAKHTQRLHSTQIFTSGTSTAAFKLKEQNIN